MTEQTVFNFIPFAGARWKMTDVQRQAGFIRKFLQFELAETIAIAITAATVGGN